MAANVNDQRIINLINQTVEICRGHGPLNDVDITNNLGSIDIIVHDYDDQRQIVLFMKRWFETRFVQQANAGMPNGGFNAESVAAVKTGFHNRYNEWLDIRLPSDNMGSAMTILHSLHARLTALERLHTSSQ
jgi:hypothetical protein